MSPVHRIPLSFTDAWRARALLARVATLAVFSSPAEEERIVSGLRWIGLFSDAPVTPRGNLLDTLCATLEAKMQYEEGERDMVVLQHKFEIENKDGSKVRLIVVPSDLSLTYVCT